MSDEEFAHFLYICRAERDAKQARMAEHLARRPYFYDIDQEILTVGGASHRITVIGTFCLSRGTWLWGWANDSYSEAARQRSAALKGLRGVIKPLPMWEPGPQAGMRQIWQPRPSIT